MKIAAAAETTAAPKANFVVYKGISLTNKRCSKNNAVQMHGRENKIEMTRTVSGTALKGLYPPTG